MIAYKNNVRINIISLCTVISLFLTNCAKKTTPETNNLASQELKTLAQNLIKDKAYEEAKTVLEKLITHYPDDTNIHTHKLTLADTYFNLAQYHIAQKLYEHYYQTYPADTQSEYAQYKAIQAQSNQILTIDRDQTITEETLASCSQYLNNLTNKKFRNEIKSIHKDCTFQLIEKEIYVFNFYLAKGNTLAAKNRLENLKKTYLKKETSLEPNILYLETALAHKEQNHDNLTKSLDNLIKKYPDSEFTLKAQNLTQKNNFFF